MSKLKLPILPIPNVVFFPHASLPLLIEEPSYVQMIRDCESAREEHGPNAGLLGISLAQPLQVVNFNSRRPRIEYRPSLICSIGIPMIIDELPGGGIKVLVKGTNRAKLGSLVQNLPFPIFNATILKPSQESSGFTGNEIENIFSVLDIWVKKNVTDSIEREAFMASLEGPEHIVDYVSMLLIADKDIRQVLLETELLIERIHLLNSLLRNKRPLGEDPTVVRAIKRFEIIEKNKAIGQ